MWMTVLLNKETGTHSFLTSRETADVGIFSFVYKDEFCPVAFKCRHHPHCCQWTPDQKSTPLVPCVFPSEMGLLKCRKDLKITKTTPFHWSHFNGMHRPCFFKIMARISADFAGEGTGVGSRVSLLPRCIKSCECIVFAWSGTNLLKIELFIK